MNPIQRFYPSGRLCGEAWNQDGRRFYYELWFQDSRLHRVDNPAYQRWFRDGKLNSQSWFVHGKRIVNLRRYLTRRGLIQ